MRRLTLILLCALPCAGMARSMVIVEDTFDNQPAHKGVPYGYRLFGHEARDKGVMIDPGSTPNQCAYVQVDFDGDTWGAVLLREGGDWKLLGTTLSVKVRASADLAGREGSVGFKLIDADGTEYRTGEKDLFRPGTAWRTFSLKARDLEPDDVKGSKPKLDLGHIARFGVAFYDRGDHNEQVTFFLDDLKAEKP